LIDNAQLFTPIQFCSGLRGHTQTTRIRSLSRKLLIMHTFLSLAPLLRFVGGYGGIDKNRARTAPKLYSVGAGSIMSPDQPPLRLNNKQVRLAWDAAHPVAESSHASRP
jgi:hypothetical protein